MPPSRLSQPFAASRFQRSSDHVFVYPFASTDHENIRNFAERIDRAFLPRPQRDSPPSPLGNRHPEISLPAVFDAFREILKKPRLNLASTVQLSATREMTTDDEIAARDGENPNRAGPHARRIRHLYHAGLWAAIRSRLARRIHRRSRPLHRQRRRRSRRSRARWMRSRKPSARRPDTPSSPPTRRASSICAPTCAIRRPGPKRRSTSFSRRSSHAEEREWVLDEFAKPFECGERVYAFEPAEIKRLAVKFGAQPEAQRELFDSIAARRNGAAFDFEPSLDEAETLTTAKELIFYMHWLKLRGRPAQLVPPNLGFKKRQAYPEPRAALDKYTSHKMWPELMPASMRVRRPSVAELKDRVRELADVARYFDGTLSIHSGSGKQAEVLRSIGTADRRAALNYKISGELQLQLFDVLVRAAGRLALSARSTIAWSQRCERFAARGAFGEESALAAQYRASGHGSYLGDAARGPRGRQPVPGLLAGQHGGQQGRGRQFLQRIAG